ncbi:MAG: ferritin family protein [Candidatus Cloacimonetes bacterium]|nr:ferritin family protein [Candidatus Cloacimonadota bacterium]
MTTRKEALLFAIENEVKSQNLYRALANAFKDTHAVEMFTRLVPMEKAHEEKLIALYRHENPEDELTINYALIPILTEGEHLDDPEGALEFAIKRENIAEAGYLNFAKTTDDAELKKLFMELAAEEKNHAELLQDEINRIHGSMIWFDASELDGFMEG